MPYDDHLFTAETCNIVLDKYTLCWLKYLLHILKSDFHDTLCARLQMAAVENTISVLNRRYNLSGLWLNILFDIFTGECHCWQLSVFTQIITHLIPVWKLLNTQMLYLSWNASRFVTCYAFQLVFRLHNSVSRWYWISEALER